MRTWAMGGAAVGSPVGALGSALLGAGRRDGLRRVVGGPADRLDDVGVARAAADLAGDRLADLGVGRVGVLVEQGARGEQHAGRAEPALQPVLGDEALL